MAVAYSNIYDNRTYDIEFKIIEFTNVLSSFLKTIAGFIGIVLIFMPLYYLILAPAIIISYKILYKSLFSNMPEIKEQFRQFSNNEKQDFLSELKKSNKEFAKKNKLMFKNSKGNLIYFKPVHKNAKRLNNLLIDFEDDLYSISTNEKFSVSALSDSELLNLVKHSQKAHSLV